MGINKVEYGEEVLIDLTEDDVTPEDVLKGVTFHGSDGEKKTGKLIQSIDATTTSTDVLEKSANGNIRSIRLEGNSYKSRNLLNSILQTTTTNGVTCTQNKDGTYTLKGTASADTYFSIGKLVGTIGKQYKLLGCPNGGSKNTYTLYWNENATFEDYGVGVVATIYQSELNHNVGIRIKSGTVCNDLVFKPMITEYIYSTYNDFEPYGIIVPSGDIESQSKNLWSENPISLVASQGKNFNVPLKKGTYFIRISSDSTTDGAYNFSGILDSAYEVLVNTTWIATKDGLKFTTSKDYDGLRFNSNANFNGNIMISESEEITDYVPYGYSKVHTDRPLLSVGDIKNELIINEYGSGVFIERVGSVDLGSLPSNYYEYFKVEQGNLFRVTIPTIKKNNYNVIPNVLTALYTPTTYSERTNMTVSIGYGADRIDFINDEYTDKESFKTAMTGVELIYELATSITTDLTKEEVSALLNLETFADTTYINTDGCPFEVSYFVDNNVGNAISCVDEKVNSTNKKVITLSETISNQQEEGYLLKNLYDGTYTLGINTAGEKYSIRAMSSAIPLDGIAYIRTAKNPKGMKITTFSYDSTTIASGTKLIDWTADTNEHKIEVSNKYIRFCFQNATNSALKEADFDGLEIEVYTTLSNSELTDKVVRAENDGFISRNLYDGNLVSNLYPIASGKVNSSDANAFSLIIKVEPNTTYTIQKIASYRFRLGFTNGYPKLDEVVYGYVDAGSNTSVTMTAPSNANYLIAYVYHSTNDTLDKNTIINSIQIEKGSVATSYTKFAPSNITLDEKIKEVNEKIVHHIELGYLQGNIFNEKWIEGNIREDGYETIASTTNRKSVDYTEVSEPSYYILMNPSSAFYIAEYDANKTFIKRTQIKTSGWFDIDSNTKYVRCVAYKNGGIQPSDYQNISISAEKTDYVPYALSNVALTKTITDNKNNGFLDSENLYNPSAREENKYLDDVGVTAYSDVTFASEYIPMKGDTDIIYRYKRNDTAYWNRVHAYDSSKNWISMLLKESETNLGEKKYLLKTPSNCAYIRFANSKGSSDIVLKEYIPSNKTLSDEIANLKATENVIFTPTSGVTVNRITAQKSNNICRFNMRITLSAELSTTVIGTFNVISKDTDNTSYLNGTYFSTTPHNVGLRATGNRLDLFVDANTQKIPSGEYWLNGEFSV